MVNKTIFGPLLTWGSIKGAANQHLSVHACGSPFSSLTQSVLKYGSELMTDLGDPLSVSLLLGKTFTLPLGVLPSVIKYFVFLILHIPVFRGSEGVFLTSPLDLWLLLSLSFSLQDFLSLFGPPPDFSSLLSLTFCWYLQLTFLAAFLLKCLFFILFSQISFRGISADIDVKGKGLLGGWERRSQKAKRGQESSHIGEV